MILATSDPILHLSVPIPPSDNNLVRLARLGAYPTNDYREWLRVAAPILDDAMAATQGDVLEPREWLRSIGREPWYEVHTELNLPGGRRDGANYEKALFDLISGKRLENPAKKSSKLVMGAGLWPDDSLIRSHTTTVMARREPEPEAIVSVFLMRPPYDDAAGFPLRARCIKAVERMIAGAACHCLGCTRRITDVAVCVVVPGKGATAEFLCERCRQYVLTDPTAMRRIVSGRPELHWEHTYHRAFSSHYGPISSRYTDLIWEEI